MSAVSVAAVLCGGRGTRLQGEDPKPLVAVGGRPIVWHVVAILAAQGVRRVLLLTGHQAARVAAYAAGAAWPQGVTVECLDTGEGTPTGGRVLAAGPRLGAERFLLAYGDGVADVDLSALAATHARTGAWATMTVVRPELPFGVARLDGGDRVTGFEEKPRSAEWVNGGFFLLEAGVRGYLAPDSTLEREPLERLAAEGRLAAHRHEGFWACMDTRKDAVRLNALWAAGAAPWAPVPK